MFELGPHLFRDYNAVVHKARSKKTWFVSVRVEELKKALTSTPLNTFAMNCNNDPWPGLPTDFSAWAQNAPAEWAEIQRKPFRKSGGNNNSNKNNSYECLDQVSTRCTGFLYNPNHFEPAFRVENAECLKVWLEVCNKNTQLLTQSHKISYYMFLHNMHNWTAFQEHSETST